MSAAPMTARSVLSALALAALAAGTAQAQAQSSAGAGGWELGAVLDLAATSRSLALGQREQGLALGHSDLTARGPLGSWFSAQATAAVHQHEGKVEAELEEAWLQTRGLPGGLQVRLGRFSSQIGALNEQHPHADDFVERPLLYRAFLGGHWFDDGLRLNWTAPTPFFLQLGAEVFRGRQLVREAASARSPGAFTLSARAGGDLGASHSWQLGTALLHNRREAAVEDEHGHGDEAAHGDDDGDEHGDSHGEAGHEHHHAHGALYNGRRLWLSDLTWKWAPDGNNRQQQLRVTAEYARISGLNRYAAPSDRHRAAALSVVWRFRQDLEAGMRSDWLRVRTPHGDHFHDGRLREHALMLAWKPTHQQTLRLQLSAQRDAVGIEDVARRVVQLQYIISLGAHGAHAF